MTVNPTTFHRPGTVPADRTAANVNATALTPEAVADAAEAHDRYLADRVDVNQQIRTADTRRKEAEATDRRAYADAIAAGKADPGAKATGKLEAELLALRRRRDALTELIAEDSFDDLAHAIAGARAHWHAALADDAESLRSDLSTVLAKAEQLADAVALNRATRAWLTESDTRLRRFRAPTRHARPNTSDLAGWADGETNIDENVA